MNASFFLELCECWWHRNNTVSCRHWFFDSFRIRWLGYWLERFPSLIDAILVDSCCELLQPGIRICSIDCKQNKIFYRQLGIFKINWVNQFSFIILRGWRSTKMITSFYCIDYIQWGGFLNVKSNILFKI